MPGERCINGVCMCGSSRSCEGLISGSYCDAMNSKCKCSKSVDACPFPETCDIEENVCKCGTGVSCASNKSAGFCDSDASQCKCSRTKDACQHWQDCSDGKCLGINFA